MFGRPHALGYFMRMRLDLDFEGERSPIDDLKSLGRKMGQTDMCSPCFIQSIRVHQGRTPVLFIISYIFVLFIYLFLPVLVLLRFCRVFFFFSKTDTVSAPFYFLIKTSLNNLCSRLLFFPSLLFLHYYYYFFFIIKASVRFVPWNLSFLRI